MKVEYLSAIKLYVIQITFGSTNIMSFYRPLFKVRTDPSIRMVYSTVSRVWGTPLSTMVTVPTSITSRSTPQCESPCSHTNRHRGGLSKRGGLSRRQGKIYSSLAGDLWAGTKKLVLSEAKRILHSLFWIWHWASWGRLYSTVNNHFDRWLTIMTNFRWVTPSP